MRTPPFRTVVVENHEGFCRLLCLMLKEKTPCEVIAQLSDGLEAVKAAEQLQPDLIILDLRLPKLNGMEVAQRIRKLCPGTKILIVSQNSSTEIAQGAHGYLIKSDAANRALAVDAVLQNRQFVSPSLISRGLTLKSETD
jgi:DNA-binding NarL/FixJ family response regulator